MSYEREEAMRVQEATEDMIRMRTPVAPTPRARVRDNWEAYYRALKDKYPAEYQKAIQGIEAVTLTFNVPTKAAAEYERTAVMILCDVLHVMP